MHSIRTISLKCIRRCSSQLVYLSSMANPNDQDYEFLVPYFIDYPVAADSEPVIVLLCTGKLYDVILQNFRIFGKNEKLFFDNFLEGEIDLL